MKRIPDQIIRVSIPFILIGVLLIAAKIILTPSSFGKYGHYRGDAVDDNMSKEIHYGGQQACADCHDDIVELKGLSYHANVSCEVCHGPSQAHIEAPDEHIPSAPRDRGFCPLCHSYLNSRPTGFPQIITLTHNPGEPCISCHNPHDPTPPTVPEECSACHADIARTKLVSPHVNLACTQCHNAPELHKIEPRLARPTKPTSRDACGECHSKEAPGSKKIPRIDLATHNETYVCWECHYPHLPEALGGTEE